MLSEPDINVRMDLEQYRTLHGLSYAQLADLIGVRQAKQSRSYALGHSWPRAEQMQKILKKTKGFVTVEAMHMRRLSFHGQASLANRQRSEKRVA